MLHSCDQSNCLNATEAKIIVVAYRKKCLMTYTRESTGLDPTIFVTQPDCYAVNMLTNQPLI